MPGVSPSPLKIHLFLLTVLLLLGITAVEGENVTRGSFHTPALLPRAHYSLVCRIDTAERCLAGTETIRFTNQSTRPLTRLGLDWSLRRHESLEIVVNGAAVRVMTDSSDPAKSAPLLFDLPEELSRGMRAEITIHFTQSLPMLGMQDKITLTHWFPKLWWGVQTHDDYDVKVDVPSGYALGTSGRWDNTNRQYHAEDVGTFGLFLGKGLQVMEKSAGDVLVRCLFSAQGRECADLVLKTAVDAINFYRERFGFYPYKSLDIVPGYEEPWGGYNAATSLSVIHGEEKMAEKPALHWQWITAHEIGHMYWGEYVLEKDSPGWLWIGLGIYADREYVRARGLSLQMHRKLMARYTKGVKEHVNTTVAITPEQWEDVDFDFNNIVTHGKGFSLISALASYLGKETFERIYSRCLKQFGAGRMGAAEFQAVCEAESGEELGWFFDEWVRSNKYLSYRIASQTSAQHNGEYTTAVSVKRTGTMKYPVPVVAYFADGTSQRKAIERQQDVNVLEFHTKAPLRHVAIDPDSELAVITPPPEMTANELAKAVEHLPYTGAGAEALTLFSSAQALNSPGERTWYKLGLTLYDGEYYPEALMAFQRTVELSKDSSAEKFAGHVWQGHLLDLLGHREEAIQEYRLALREGTDYEMHYDSYDLVVNRAWTEGRLLHPFIRK